MGLTLLPLKYYSSILYIFMPMRCFNHIFGYLEENVYGAVSWFAITVMLVFYVGMLVLMLVFLLLIKNISGCID